MPDFGRWTSNGGDPSLNEINRVDRFFDALASNDTAYSTDNAEAELAFLFADWRDDVRDAPPTVQLTTRDAVAALESGRSRRSRSSLALVGSVAAAVLCVGGFGAAVYGAESGDALYGMRTTMFGQESSRDDQVVLSAQTEMMQVQKLIDQGQWQQAQDKLVALSTTVQTVDQPEQKQQLTQQFNALTYKVVEQDPAATLPPPGEPQPVLPDSPLTLLPVPVVVDSSTPTSSTPTSIPTSPSSDTPGPEIALTAPPSSENPGPEGEPGPPSSPPSSPSSGPSSPPSSAPSSPPSSLPSSPPSSAPSAPPSGPPSAPAQPPAEVTSVMPAPPVVPAPAQPPAPAPQPPSPVSVAPAPPPRLAPNPEPLAPPAGGSPGVGQSVAPIQPVEPPAAPEPPKRSSGEEQGVPATTVMPPH